MVLFETNILYFNYVKYHKILIPYSISFNICQELKGNQETKEII